jgi:hypothetical protein
VFVEFSIDRAHDGRHYRAHDRVNHGRQHCAHDRVHHHE